jgi:hypothetical protein
MTLVGAVLFFEGVAVELYIACSGKTFGIVRCPLSLLLIVQAWQKNPMEIIVGLSRSFVLLLRSRLIASFDGAGRHPHLTSTWGCPFGQGSWRLWNLGLRMPFGGFGINSFDGVSETPQGSTL